MTVLAFLALAALQAPGSQAEHARGSVSGGQTPKEVVAGLVRDAMRRPAEPEAWRSLAGALPGISASGGPELSRAAALADSLARSLDSRATEPGIRSVILTSPPSAAGVTRRAEGAEAESADPSSIAALIPARIGTGVRAGARRARSGAAVLGAWMGSRSMGVRALATVVAGLVLGVAVVGFMRRARRRAPEQTTSPVSAPAPSLGKASPSALWTVRSLADNGVPLLEIARKTGMAQDTLSFMLSPAGRHRDPEAPTAETGGAEALVSAVVAPGRASTGVRPSGHGFRDGRVTYGHGRAS